jgi:transcriptional regulator with XRE-family HTH domain
MNESKLCKKIKELSRSKNTPLKIIASKICMSESGFLKSLNNDLLKVTNLQKIADVLEVPITYFFDEDIIFINKQSSIIEEQKLNKTEFNQLYGFLIAQATRDGKTLEWLSRAFPTFFNLIEHLNNSKP